MKTFISYSHCDDLYRERLEIQLTMLKRQEIISSWTDRKITPGEEWDGQIDKNLEAAHIILLLISPDFLASEYCYDKEMQRAMEKHESRESIVIPILIRPCDWTSAPFSKLQVLPSEAKEVSKWINADDAWLDILNGIKNTISYMEERSIQDVSKEIAGLETVNDTFLSWLGDTEIELVHRRVDKISLDDVFVWPDLKLLKDDIDHVSRSISASEALKKEPFILIFGDEQSGKTTLSKSFFKELLGKSKTPILIQGEVINSADITKLIQASFAQQYSDQFDYVNVKDKVLIVDNYSRNKLNKKYQNKLIQNIKSEFEEVILIAIDSYQYVAPEIEALDVFCDYEILSFGNVKRTELIERWVSMGVVEEIDEALLYKEVDEIKVKVEALTRGGILPPKPIFILTLLQMFESLNPQKVELTSYGHCYQYLIYQALEKSRVKNSEIDQYINLLTELGYAQLINRGLGFNAEQLNIFFNDYNNKYLNLGKKEMLENLLGSGILVERTDQVIFKYSYIYYFFAAKKLAESISNDENAKAHVKDLLTNLHREDSANIIIFLTHHSKDNWVLDEIQLCSMELFDEYEEAHLKKESLQFMVDFLEDIPELVIEHRKVEDERRNNDERLEEIEGGVKKRNEQNEGMEPTDILAKINRAFKGIEIIGQIIRNRHGSINKEQLEQLALQAYGVGLRFLKFFLTISDNSKEEVIKSIAYMLRENPSITNEKLEKEARNIFLLITYGAIYGVLKKVSMSIGSTEAEQIYKKIEEGSPSPAKKLINQAIYLQFSKNLDARTVQELAHEFKNNPTCERLLKEIVIQHIYMFPVDYKRKQKIADILGIPVSGQLMLERKKGFRA